MAHKYTPEQLLGFPFQELPGNPPEHKIINNYKAENGELIKVRAGAVMTVYNDAMLMDAIKGKGWYKASYRRDASKPPDPREVFMMWVYQLACVLYGGPPDIERYMPCEHRGVRFEAGVGRVEP
jgi:hypothetical protein